MSFAVVHFLETDEVSVISRSWLIAKNLCYWPPTSKLLEVKAAMLEHRVPGEDWLKYDVSLMGRYYGTYHKAKVKADLALDTSNLDTESSEVEKKGRAKRHRARSYSSSDEDIPKRQKTLNVPMPRDVPLLDSIFGEVIPRAEVPTSGPSHQVLYNGGITSLPLNVALAEAAPTPTERRILGLLEDVKEMLSHLLASKEKVEVSDESLPSLPPLPNSSMEQLTVFEDFLNDESRFTQCVKSFSHKINADFKASTRHLLSSLMTNELAVNFNWAGRGNKRAFKDLKSFLFILCTIRNDRRMQSVASEDIEDVIKNWLKHATFRLSYKKK